MNQRRPIYRCPINHSALYRRNERLREAFDELPKETKRFWSAFLEGIRGGCKITAGGGLGMVGAMELLVNLLEFFEKQDIHVRNYDLDLRPIIKEAANRKAVKA